MRALLRVLVCGNVFAQTSPPPPHPCRSDPVYRQLDFWIGEWSVVGPKGKTAGKSKIEPILDGCVILEN